MFGCSNLRGMKAQVSLETMISFSSFICIWRNILDATEYKNISNITSNKFVLIFNLQNFPAGLQTQFDGIYSGWNADIVFCQPDHKYKSNITFRIRNVFLYMDYILTRNTKLNSNITNNTFILYFKIHWNLIITLILGSIRYQGITE